MSDAWLLVQEDRGGPGLIASAERLVNPRFIVSIESLPAGVDARGPEEARVVMTPVNGPSFRVLVAMTLVRGALAYGQGIVDLTRGGRAWRHKNVLLSLIHGDFKTRSVPHDTNDARFGATAGAAVKVAGFDELQMLHEFTGIVESIPQAGEDMPWFKRPVRVRFDLLQRVYVVPASHVFPQSFLFEGDVQRG